MRLLPYSAIVVPSFLLCGHGFRLPPPTVMVMRSPSFQLLSSVAEESPTRNASQEQPTSANSHSGGEDHFAPDMTEATLSTTRTKLPSQSPMLKKRKSTTREKVYNANLAKLAAFKQKRGHCNVPRKYANDPPLGRWVTRQRNEYRRKKNGAASKITDERVAALNKLGFNWDPGKSTYDTNFAKLVAFKHKHGHCNVPQKYAQDPSLGRWVCRPREEYKRKQKGLPSQITKEQVEALNELGFVWDLRKSIYDAYLAKLATFIQKYGHCNVPQRYDQDPSLGIWVSRKRNEYKRKQNGLPNRMTDEQVEVLNGLGFVWDPSSSIYEAYLAKLATFKQKHGHCNVPKKYAEDPSFGGWVNSQRVFYKRLQDGLPSQITNERVAALNKLSFDWYPSKSAVDANLAKLAAFKQKHGHCIVPTRYAEDPSLAIWVNNQRANYNKQQKGLSNQITDERVAALNKLSFEWNLGKSTYDANLAKLATFKQKHGHCNVPIRYAEDPLLGVWVSNQRVFYKKKQNGLPSQITDERVAMLNELGFYWDPGKSTYDANLAKLAMFKQKHGHCNVPIKYAADPSLGVWVHNQRGNYKKQRHGAPSPITNERVAALDELGFDWKCKNET